MQNIVLFYKEKYVKLKRISNVTIVTKFCHLKKILKII